MAAALKPIIGDKVLAKDGREVAVEELCGEGKIIGLYFSAHWCPPCRMFTPKLAAFYEKIHKEKNLEIVFVSCDRDDKGFNEYYATMPWMTMPYDDKYASKEDAMAKFGVRGIPMLIFVDGATGKVLVENGRGEVEGDPEGVKFPSWKE